MRTYVYVDGESHYVRSSTLWRKLYGDEADLSWIGVRDRPSGGVSYPNSGPPAVRVEARTKFFWDTYYPFLAPHPRIIDGAIYFTAFSGDEVDFHNVCVAIRKHGFDPRVTRERSHLAEQRKNRLSNTGLLEKAKGVDVGLAVRLLEDAYHNIFDVCYLFTSDIDFLPVIRVLHRIGRKVIVFGYSDGLSNRSELEYVPDAFVDLAEHMRSNYLLVNA